MISKVEKDCNSSFYDCGYPQHEHMPRVFHVNFQERVIGSKHKVAIVIDGKQVGDALSDNNIVNDGYRYHDIFHLSYLAVLGWSACMRALFLKKRKSNAITDEWQDGARATSAEEGMVHSIFMYAEECNFFEGYSSIDPTYLAHVKRNFKPFEVNNKSCEDWEKAILKGFEVFRQLKANAGGVVEVNMYEKDIRYLGKPISTVQ